MGLNIWNVVAMQERELTSIQKLWRMRLIRRSANVAFLVTYSKLSNAVLKAVMKAHVHSVSLLREPRTPPRVPTPRPKPQFSQRAS